MVGVPEPLEPALARLRPLLADLEHLVRAVGGGRRRGAHPAFARADLRPVRLKAGLRLQVTTTDARRPTPSIRTANHAPGVDAEGAVDALLAEPFSSWHVQTRDQIVQLRVTKSGDAQIHRQAAARQADRREAVDDARTEHDRTRQHLLDPGDPLFAALGADADKRRQVDAFLRQLLAAADRTIERARAEGRPLRVVDLGCGNAYLTFAAHRYLSALLPGGVRTRGVDVRPELVDRNARLAGELGLAGLQFAVGTIHAAEPGAGVDIVLALHACDTATDDALARAVAWRAPVVLAAPCCHHDVQRQLDAARAAGLAPPEPHAALVRHPILRERFADVLTDTLRSQLLRLAGYRVDVVEFVDSRHTPRNALLRAERRDDGDGPPHEALSAEHAQLAAAWHVRPALADRLDGVLPALTGVGR
jgi:SAM-dependent methyltransferase